MSPTVTAPAMTHAGMILGTAAYMSPEQSRGQTVDKRADIWAFGCVLFEMLSGKRAFAGDDVSDVLASVLAREPNWTRLPATLSPTLETYIRRCLQKDQRQRIHDIADVRLALEGAFETASPQRATPPTPSSNGVSVAWVVAAVVAAAALAIPAVRHLRETPSTAPLETRTEIVTPGAIELTSFALSPDGRQIVFVASGDGVSRLWVRSLAVTTAQPLSGTEGARLPFWSPDSRSIGFFAGGSLKRLDLGVVRRNCWLRLTHSRRDVELGRRHFVFVKHLDTLDPHSWNRECAHRRYVFLVTDDGPYVSGLSARRAAGSFFYAQGGRHGGIYLGTLERQHADRLTHADSAECSVHQGGSAVGAGKQARGPRLDLAQAALTGEPVTLATGLRSMALRAAPCRWQRPGW